MLTRRLLLSGIGAAGGSMAMFQAMASLGLSGESNYSGPPKLDGNVRGTSVVVLGAGLAGMVGAMELRKAGYKVDVLEYNSRPGGRCWTIRGGDSYTELGGETQHCAFAPGQYFDPGPWRIPYHHRAILDYCSRLGIALEPFNQVNYNAYLHSQKAFDGQPQRYRTINADYQGHIAELLAKATSQQKLADEVSREDVEILLESLRTWGALDKDYRYQKNVLSGARRGWAVEPGGGLASTSLPGDPVGLSDVLKSRLWETLWLASFYEFQTPIFQPVGGMDMVAKGFARQVGDLIRYNAQVSQIDQDDQGVTIRYKDKVQGGAEKQIKADYCLCTLPLSTLSQIPVSASGPLQAAIGAVSYAAAIKIGLQFKRRFWETEEAIYGGITHTDLPISQIAYPSYGMGRPGPGVLLGGYTYGVDAYDLSSRSASERVAEAVRQGTKIHPQYPQEFDSGMTVAWHRMPTTLGCFAMWTDDLRTQHYDNLCRLDGRLVLAGEHASHLPGWQEGAILSSLDAISRLHKKVVTA